MTSVNSGQSLWKDASVVITGASGVMGQALVKYLREQDFTNVTSLTSRDADLTDTRQTEDLMRRCAPALVFHLAGRVAGIMGNMRDRGRAFLDNARININVIEAARAANVTKIVAMGTTAIYSDIAPLPMNEDDVWLGPPHHSEAPYAQAKRAMLAQLQAYHEQYGMDYAFAISTNLFGPGDKFNEATGHVIPSLISKFHRAAQTGSAVEVWGNGQPQRDFLFAADAAAALLLIADRGTGPINMATGSPVSIRECVETIAKVTGHTGPINWDATKPNGQMMRDYNVQRLQTLGFKPSYTLEQGLAATYAWFEANVDAARR